MRIFFLFSVLTAVCVTSTNATATSNVAEWEPLIHGRPCARRGGASSNSTSTSDYKLTDSYDATNFFDMFTFFDGADPTNGFVLYQNGSEASRLGLVQNLNDSAVLKVDHVTKLHGDLAGNGRMSVRLESVASYAEGLIVADFSHLPQAKCGIWPAFWTYAREPAWPAGGEIDIYEQWNKYPYNRQSLHMNASITGDCSLAVSYNTFDPAMTNYNYTNDCNVVQPDNIGCSTWDFEGPYGSHRGGVYALELSATSNALKLWSWHHDDTPADIASGSPAPSTWGTPGLSTGGSACDVGSTFANQTIVLNIDLCGDAVGGVEWVDSGCAAETGYNSCERYVAANPGDFADVWFGVRTLKVYQIKGV